MKRLLNNLIRQYDTNDDVLVVKKVDVESNNCDCEFFLVPKEEWLGEDVVDATFHLFETKIENNVVSLLLVCGGHPLIYKECELSERCDYVEV